MSIIEHEKKLGRLRVSKCGPNERAVHDNRVLRHGLCCTFLSSSRFAAAGMKRKDAGRCDRSRAQRG